MAKDDKWMEKIMKDGSLHRMLNVKPGTKIPLHTLAKAAHSTNVVLERKAVAAENMQKANASR